MHWLVLYYIRNVQIFLFLLFLFWYLLPIFPNYSLPFLSLPFSHRKYPTRNTLIKLQHFPPHQPLMRQTTPNIINNLLHTHIQMRILINILLRNILLRIVKLPNVYPINIGALLYKLR